MATNNRKDNHFFAIFHVFASFSRNIFQPGSFVKTISGNTLIWKKLKNLARGFYFWLKKKKSIDKILSKNYVVK